MNTKHGVLSGNTLRGLEGGVEVRWDGGIPPHLPGLCALAENHHLTHLWVMRDAQSYIPDEAFFAEAAHEWDLKPTWEFRTAPVNIEVPNRLRSVFGWHRGGGQGVNIIFAGKQAKWRWLQDERLASAELLSLVGDLERQLGVPVGGSPANTGVKYLRQTHPKHAEWFAPPAVNLAELPFQGAARDILWTRVPEEEELNRTHLVKIDKGSAYARAGQEFKFGVGAPVHYEEQAEVRVEAPGIWNITILVEPVNEFFPRPTWFTQPYQWVATPILRFLEDIGARYLVHEGWYFPESHYIFKQWAENLWGFRKQHAPGSARADAYKQVINETIGLTASGMFDEGNFKFRPDWYDQFVGGNRAIMLRNLARFVELLGYPLIVHIDSIVYAVNAPLHEIMPDNRESLGGYKHEWSLQMTAEIREILTANNGSARKLQALNRLADERGED